MFSLTLFVRNVYVYVYTITKKCIIVMFFLTFIWLLKTFFQLTGHIATKCLIFFLMLENKFLTSQSFIHENLVKEGMFLFN